MSLVSATALAATALPVPAQAAVVPAVSRACDAAVAPGWASCFALRRTDLAPAGVGASGAPLGYGPTDLRSAYRLPASGGAGATVAIVDAYDDPTAAADLAAYRTQYGLPACGTGDGCFRKVNQNGGTSPMPAPDAGWAAEISLDLDMVSAICPDCRILLVEADSAADSDLFTAEDQAVALGARFVSNSWGGDEWSGQTQADAHFRHPGVAITASTGDNGTGAVYPATSRYVTAVGGTSLRRTSTSRGWTETAWSGAGSGCSAFDTAATWQTVPTGCAARAEADVAAVADPGTGVATYDTYGAPGWQVYGGTSVAAPIIAAVYALAGTPGSADYPAAYPYQRAGSLFDVTSGTNGGCGGPICTSGTGWDGPTGLGTPNGLTAFAATAPARLTVAPPGDQAGYRGAATSVTLSATGSSGSCAWSATGLPGGLAIGTTSGVISGTPTIAGAFPVTATVTCGNGTASTSFAWTISGTGTVVAIRAHANGQYVTAEDAGAGALIANRSAIGGWEQFDQVDLGTGYLALRAHANGRYVTAAGASTALVADATSIGTAQQFQLVSGTGGSSLRARADGDYVTAEDAGASALIANRGAAGAWEQFDLLDPATAPPPPTVLSLAAHANGRYVTAENAGASALIANRGAAGAWEQFDVVDAGGGYVALRAHANGRYVTAENAGAGALIANRTAIGGWEKFQLVSNGDGSVSLLAAVNGRYVTTDNGGASALIANRTAIGAWEEFN